LTKINLLKVYLKIYLKKENLSSLISSDLRSIQNENSLEWNSSSNEMSMSSINDLDDFDPKSRKFSNEDLRPQPVLRKSKKVCAFFYKLKYLSL